MVFVVGEWIMKQKIKEKKKKSWKSKARTKIENNRERTTPPNSSN
jgi:hypothetical protein